MTATSFEKKIAIWTPQASKTGHCDRPRKYLDSSYCLGYHSPPFPSSQREKKSACFPLGAIASPFLSLAFHFSIVLTLIPLRSDNSWLPKPSPDETVDNGSTAIASLLLCARFWTSAIGKLTRSLIAFLLLSTLPTKARSHFG